MPLELSLCHGDLWHDHILFRGRQVCGFIDFDNLHIDSPLIDLARLLGSLLGHVGPRWRAAEDWYFDCQQLVDPSTARHVVQALDQAGVLLSGINWLRWILLDQRQFDWQRVEPRLMAIGIRLRQLRRGVTVDSGGPVGSCRGGGDAGSAVRGGSEGPCTLCVDLGKPAPLQSAGCLGAGAIDCNQTG